MSGSSGAEALATCVPLPPDICETGVPLLPRGRPVHGARDPVDASVSPALPGPPPHPLRQAGQLGLRGRGPDAVASLWDARSPKHREATTSREAASP